VFGQPVASLHLGPGVLAWFTGRAGGCSTGDWATLNLGLHVGDDPQHVVENRRRVAGWAGGPVVFGRQVHGTRCAVLSEAWSGDGDPLTGDLGERDGGYDAIVTQSPGTAVGVLVADCVPVLLADAEAGVVAAAHAGRVGLLAGVLTSVVAAMQRAGARPGGMTAALGPAAGPCCYEVPQAMQDEACAALPALRARTTAGTPSLDLRAGCRAALATAGVRDVRLVGGCTIEDDGFYSYRRSPVTGRFAGVVKMVG
jgi:hypothetical protein